MSYPFILTGNSVVITTPKGVVTVQQDAPNYQPLYAALKADDWDEVNKNLTVTNTLETWSKGHFKFEGQTILYKGEKVPSELASRMVAMATAGDSPEPLMKFWEKLQRNPSWRSVEQLFPFLQHQGIPILANGNFYAYKGVNTNYTDKHTGTVDNRPGTVHEMPRNRISDDPKTPCHYGYHVGARSYAESFGQILVICEVDPADVVCIPYDESHRKMRVCKYKVVGNDNGEHLPSTAYELEDKVGAAATLQDEDTPEMALNDAEKALADQHNRLDAIREVRNRLGIPLKEAKDLVDAYRSSLQPEEATPALEGFGGKPAFNSQVVRAGNVSKPKPQSKEKRALGKRPKLVVPARYRKIHTMTMSELLKQHLEGLRAYATKVLHIVGASKIPGGKVSLVRAILKTRKQFD